MKRRIEFERFAPAALQAMLALERAVKDSGLEPRLLELVKLRASYVNGCAYCVDMHTKDARVMGESEQRLFGIPVWRETPYFTPRERAALAWAEAVTELGHEGVSDVLYEEARAHFTEAELVHLTMAVVVINGWNRIAITFRNVPGSYQPSAPLKSTGS